MQSITGVRRLAVSTVGESYNANMGRSVLLGVGPRAITTDIHNTFHTRIIVLRKLLNTVLTRKW